MMRPKKHCCPKKTIDIFNFKQRLLSIDMKTKVVQHVPRILFNVFKVFKLSSFQVFKVFRFPAPVWLSDIFIMGYIIQTQNCKMHLVPILPLNGQFCRFLRDKNGQKWQISAGYIFWFFFQFNSIESFTGWSLHNYL